MSKWHYLYKEEIVFNNKDDIRNGTYLCYDSDTFDYLINDGNWVYANGTYDEQEYVIDNLDKMLESNDGEYVFIPDIKVAEKIDNYYLLEDLNFVDRYKL